MEKPGTSKVHTYDLEERTLTFARSVRAFVMHLSKTPAHIEDGKQLLRSSGSIGANYIEANESVSKKDFALRIKICRKEAKESRYWLRLLESQSKEVEGTRERLEQEALELTKIFGSIVEKFK
jgi:four helix bundle protein